MSSESMLAKAIATGSLPQVDQVLDSGSKILWSAHDEQTVGVVCGWPGHMGEPERRVKITTVWQMMKTPEYTGYCHRCGMAKFFSGKKRSGVLLLKDGYIDFDNTDAKGRTYMFCNICETGRYTNPHGEGRTGRCKKCQKLILGDVPHQSGAIVHRGKRDPKNRHRVAFTCSNPECCPDCGQKHYIYPDHAKDSSWTGRCPDCFQKLPHPNQYTGTEEVGRLKAVVDWDDRDETGKVAITCPLSNCGKQWRANFVTISARRDDPDWLACCPEHYHNPTELLTLLEDKARHAETGNGNGHPPIRLDAEGRKILEVVNAVIATWKDVQNPSFTRDENLALVKQAKVAKRLGLGDEDTPEGANKLAARLRRSHVNNMFTVGGSWFRAFVKAVVDEFERGAAPEAIVIALLRRLEAADRGA